MYDKNRYMQAFGCKIVRFSFILALFLLFLEELASGLLL